MNETILTWVIFILAFGGMVLIHEFGHFIVARLSKIEVEEFGVGLPTPGALTLWTSKGFLILKNGKRIEIPFNFRFPLAWNELIEREVKITADEVNGRLIMRSIELVRDEAPQRPATNNLELDHVYVDQHGQVEPQARAAQSGARARIKAGKTTGALELTDTVAEVHPGTRFTFNWLPFGGFVRPKGENDPGVPGGLAAASPWKRLAVLFAGPAMNLLLAILIYSVIFNQVGVPDTSRVLVASVTPNSPAAQAGFHADDIFISGNGQAIHNYDELRAIVDANPNKAISFLVERGGKQVTLMTTPRMDAQAQRVMIGVGLSVPFKAPSSPAETLKLGAQYTYLNVQGLLALPSQMLRGTLSSDQSRLVGLKGIYDILHQTVNHDVQASEAPSAASPASTDPNAKPVQTLELLASLTISLGIFNLFPFPALDGGRIIFVLPELIFRKRVSPQLENVVHMAGMLVLLLLMVYINIMDFVNPITTKIP